MKIDFFSGQVQVINYSDPKIDGNIYLDKSVLDKLREWKWLDKEILEELEFKIYPTPNLYCLYQWQISAPIPVTKYLQPSRIPEEHGIVAQWCPAITGQINSQEIDGKKIYICKY